MKRKLTALLLVLAMALAGCGGKSGGQEAASGGDSQPEAAPTESETAVTVESREEARKLAEEFYAQLLTANPISMTSYFDGEQESVFLKDGDAMYMTDGTPDFEYYVFIADGTKYLIDGSDAGSAYENEYFYDLLDEMLQTTLDLFVTGLYDAEEADDFSFSATRTDKTVDGAVVSTLVTVISGEEDGESASVTVTGTAENGVVTDIAYEMSSGEEKETAQLVFAYDNITIELPAYTVVDDDGYGSYGTVLEGEHIDSPYQTLEPLIAALGEDDYLFYTIDADHVYAVGEKDGRQLQFSALITEEDVDAIYNMDFFSDTYYEDVYAILGALAVDDCVDYTDCLVPQDELDAFAGEPVRAMVDAGFELNGWSVNEGEALLSFAKDGLEYDAEATPTDDFDENSDYAGEDLYGFTVERIAFSAPEYSTLPIR